MAVVTMVATLFLNTILGAFGLAATSIETLHNLKTSQQIVKRMKTRQAQKKLKVTKRFAKRPAKRIASAAAAAAAATVGTIGVAVAATALEANDYCDEKRKLQEDSENRAAQLRRYMMKASYHPLPRYAVPHRIHTRALSQSNSLRSICFILGFFASISYSASCLL